MGRLEKQSEFTRIRYQDGVWSGGEFQPSDSGSEKKGRGHVSNADPEEADLLPEGEVTDETIVVVTDLSLRPVDRKTKTPADRVRIYDPVFERDETFKVMKVTPAREKRAGRTSFRAVAVKA